MAYIAQSNRDAATAVAQAIWEQTSRLDAHPAIGRPGRIPGTRELVMTHAPFIVPYRVKDGGVELLRVLHTSRQWPDRF